MNQEANFIRVKLGDIRPNRFRDLNRWPLEPGVIEELKQSIREHGLWSGLRAVCNEHGEIELCYGHHRLHAALEIFGPDHEITIELTPFQGEWSLMRILHAENSIKRNPVSHLYEIVSQVMHWWDDVVFEEYPTWEDCIRAGIFTHPELERFFGPAPEEQKDPPGKANYVQCVHRGVGRRVIAKMLEGTENVEAIKQALAALPPTARRTHGLKLQTEADRRKAEELRAEAERLAIEQEALGRQMKEEAQKKQAELDRLADEERKATVEAKAAHDAEAKRLADEKQRQLKEELATKKAQRETEEKAARQAQEEKRAAINQAEEGARRAESRAANTEQDIKTRDWFDPRAAEVFDRPAHGEAFRLAVSKPDVRECLQTEDLAPLARAVREYLEGLTRRSERNKDGKKQEWLTSQRIQEVVDRNFRDFKAGIKHELDELKKITQRARDVDPVSELRRLVETSTQTMKVADHDLSMLISKIVANQIVSTQLGSIGDDFYLALSAWKRTIADFEQLNTPAEHEIQPIPLKQLAHANIHTNT